MLWHWEFVDVRLWDASLTTRDARCVSRSDLIAVRGYASTRVDDPQRRNAACRHFSLTLESVGWASCPRRADASLRLAHLNL